MDKQKINHFKQRLYEERENINRNIERLNEDIGFHVSLKEGISELSSYDNHPADIGTETFETEKNLGLRSHHTTHLRMVNDALKKIEQGKYGVCELCGKDIKDERLEVIPYATTCVSCEESRKPGRSTYFQDRPIEETAIGYPFGSNNRDPEDYTGYDGEDVWQELESYNSLNYNLWDEEDEGMQGIVEEVDKISNSQYKRQLPD